MTTDPNSAQSILGANLGKPTDMSLLNRINEAVVRGHITPQAAFDAANSLRARQASKAYTLPETSVERRLRLAELVTAESFTDELMQLLIVETTPPSQALRLNGKWYVADFSGVTKYTSYELGDDDIDGFVGVQKVPYPDNRMRDLNAAAEVHSLLAKTMMYRLCVTPRQPVVTHISMNMTARPWSSMSSEGHVSVTIEFDGRSSVAASPLPPVVRPAVGDPGPAVPRICRALIAATALATAQMMEGAPLIDHPNAGR